MLKAVQTQQTAQNIRYFLFTTQQPSLFNAERNTSFGTPMHVCHEDTQIFHRGDGISSGTQQQRKLPAYLVCDRDCETCRSSNHYCKRKKQERRGGGLGTLAFNFPSLSLLQPWSQQQELFKERKEISRCLEWDVCLLLLLLLRSHSMLLYPHRWIQARKHFVLLFLWDIG